MLKAIGIRADSFADLTACYARHLPSLLDTLKRRSFWLIARICFGLYRCLPVFGTLRASIAIIYRDGKFLVIRRNDGRGVSLPGGIASRGESEDATVRREVLEETGMRVTSAEPLTRYFSDADVPCNISVYRAQASGEIRNSWEGSPRWLTLEEVALRIVESQRPVVRLMREIAGQS